MSLPKLNTPTYQLVLPSTEKKIKFRPFGSVFFFEWKLNWVELSGIDTSMELGSTSISLQVELRNYEFHFRLFTEILILLLFFGVYLREI